MSTKDQARLQHRNDFQGEADEPDSAGQQQERDELKKQHFFFVVHQEASCFVIMFKKDTNGTFHRQVDVLFHSSTFDVVRRTHTASDMLQECQIGEYWKCVDGDRVLLRAVDRFTLLNTTPPTGYMWSGWMLTEIQATLRPKHIWPEIWSTM